MFNDMMRAEIWLRERLDAQQGIEDLARYLGYSPSQIRRNFKRCFGFSPSTYRDRLRLERAMLLLRCTDYSIHEIALKCGYRNHSAFSRAFFRHYYHSPRAYRTQERNRLDKLRQGLPHDYAFRFGRSKHKKAVVTRLYGKQAHEVHRTVDGLTLESLADHPTLDKLPDRLINNGRTIAIVHPGDMQESFSCADVGVQVQPDIAAEMAAPLLFRTLSLPACRYVSVHADSLAELPQILDFLLAKALPDNAEVASGQPPRLLWGEASVEVQLPLHEPR